uniref:Secreted protein n=1 Tax=Panagrellus redivivus TaxID=6233 RepID=A0A7E4VD76_PANRE
MKLFLPLLIVGLISCAIACNIIVHVKSATATKFSAQVTTPNGQKSTKWTFTKSAARETFQQRADTCGVGDWHVTTYDASGKQVADVLVALNGIGRVDYEVGNDLKPVQTYRQGAICNGQCAPLGLPKPPSSRPASPVNSGNDTVV